MTEYFVFHKEWNELRKNLSKNAWYELETLMLQLRWEGIDTDPLTITNKVVRSNWINIRARILNSMKNLKNKKNSKSKKEIVEINDDITPNEEFDNTIEQPQIIEDMGNYTGIQFKQQEEIEVQDYKDETTIANEFITNNGKDAYDIYYELNVLKYNEQKGTERYEELKMLWDELWTPYRVYDEETFELIKSKVAERYNKRVIKQFRLENEYKQILTA